MTAIPASPPEASGARYTLQASRLAYVPVLLLAAALRFYRLDGQSMWFDEASRLINARSDVATIVRETGGDTVPPLYHLTMHFWQWAGGSDLWVRLPSAMAGVLLVAVVYELGRSLFDRRTGLIAALVVAVMPYQVFHAQQANLYSMLVLSIALQICFFWRAMNTGRGKWFAGYVAMAAAGMYLHYFAALTTLSLHVWLLLVSYSESGRVFRKRWRPLLIADGLLLLLAMPVVAYFMRGAEDVGSGFWLTKPNIAAPLFTLQLFTAGYSLSGTWVAVTFVLTLLLLAFVLLELAYNYRDQPNQRATLLLLLLLAFLPIALVFIVSQVVPLYLDRTLIVTTPAYALLLGRALATTRLRSPTPYVAGGILCLMILSLYGYYFDKDFSKPDYRAAEDYIAQRIGPDEALIHTGNGSYIPFLFYRSAEDHFLLDGDPAPHHPPRVHETVGGQTVTEGELGAWSGIWLVVAFDHSIEYQRETLAHYDAEYPLLDEAVIDGIVLRHYDMSE